MNNHHAAFWSASTSQEENRYIFILYTCVYKVVVVKLLDYLLEITACSELEAQAFCYTRINICQACVCDQ